MKKQTKPQVASWPPAKPKHQRKPFTIKEHMATIDSLGGNTKAAKIIKGFETVSTVAGWRIVRLPKESMKPAIAHVLPEKEEWEKTFATWMPSMHYEKGTAEALMSSSFQAVKDLDEKGELLFLAAIAQKILGTLAGRARRGDGEALFRFAFLVQQSAQGLSQITKANPTAVQPVARHCGRWPIMRSTHPLNSDSDSILQEIGLNEDGLPICLDKDAKWKLDTAGTIAIHLLEYLLSDWNDNPQCVFAGNKVARLKEVLPPFSQDSAPKWWTLAECVFLRSYPEPHKVSELAAICTTPSRISPGRIKEAILTKIHQRFLHMAPVVDSERATPAHKRQSRHQSRNDANLDAIVATLAKRNVGWVD